MLLLFSQRKKLARLFEEWRSESNDGVVAANCPENVVAFLFIKGLLNEEKTIEYLKTHNPKIKDRK